ncbi:MAG: DinB family protein [Gammaproteobacteria bacterium]|nr:DinB family protein [Gammaproteobacteria bacterium]
MKPTEPQLQRPGAGLPPLELALSRAGLRLLRLALSDARATRLFFDEGRRVFEMARSTPLPLAGEPALIRRVPGMEDSSRNWSLYMVLDHLRRVNNGIARIIAALCAGEGVPGEVRIEDVKPDPDAMVEVLGSYEASVERYLQTARRIPRSAGRGTHPHPWFGPLDAHGWHCLAALHHRIHRRQIERIREQLGVSVSNAM